MAKENLDLESSIRRQRAVPRSVILDWMGSQNRQSQNLPGVTLRALFEVNGSDARHVHAFMSNTVRSMPSRNMVPNTIKTRIQPQIAEQPTVPTQDCWGTSV